jgi:5'-nucleotidase
VSQDPTHASLDVGSAQAEPSTWVLVTNDDGIGSPGLRDLARALAVDHEVVVAAPAEDVSGSGTGIGRIGELEPPALTRADFDGIEAYAIHGPPGLAVMSAALGAFGSCPGLVVSGINAGLNTGTSIIHSGTVGAALTGRTFGISGLAVSLAPGERWFWETALPVARSGAAWLTQRPGPTTLNVNVPGRPADEVLGSRWAAVDDFGHFSVASQGRGGTVIDLDVHDRGVRSPPDSDSWLCLAGFVTLTLLSPLGAVTAPDVDADLVAGTGSGPFRRVQPEDG